MPISIGSFIGFVVNQVRQAVQPQATSTTSSGTNTSSTSNTPTGTPTRDEFVQTNNANAYARMLGFAEPLASVWNTLTQQPTGTRRDPRLPEGAEVPAPLGDMSDLANLNMANATPEQIQRVQDALIELGYMSPTVRDNSGYGNTWGPTSQTALTQFQRDHGLYPNGNTLSPETTQYLGTPLTTGPFLPDGPKNVLMPQAAYEPATGGWPPEQATPDLQALQNPELEAVLTDFDSDDPAQVLAAQERLLELGYFPPEGASSSGFGNTFGPMSRQAVKDFQTAHGLNPDGKLTPETIALLAQPEQVGPHYGVNPGTIPGEYGPLGPPNALCEGALATSAAQMNPETATLEYNGVSLQEDPNVWNSMCLAFVARCYEPRIPQLSAGNALGAYNNFESAGLIVPSTENMPAGVPLFFGASDANGQNGHIVIFTGRYDESGEPIVRSSGWDGRPGIFEVSLSEMERLTGASCLGWGNITGQPNPTGSTTGGNGSGGNLPYAS